MSLKFPFKFKHAASGDEYLADKDINNVDSVVVNWIDDAGQQHRRYSLSDVKHYTNYKNWVIIEEPSPLVEITQADYDSMVEEINLLQELLAESNKRIAELETKSKFKSIKDMTHANWVVAYREGQEFKTRAGVTVTILQMDDEDSNWPIRTEDGWYRLDGAFHSDDEVPEDIIERIS